MPTAERIASLLLVLMLVQSLLGLLLSDQYRDVEWIKVTWYGNDWITLVAAVPLLSLALLHTGGNEFARDCSCSAWPATPFTTMPSICSVPR